MSKIAYNYKGCVDTFNALPTTGNTLGDYYLVRSTGIQYYWSIPSASGTVSNWKPLNVNEAVGNSQENIERSWMGF